MTIYIIKSATCMLAFLLFYKLFLERENMHNIKRFYLLGGLLSSFMIPLLTYKEYVTIENLEATSGIEELAISESQNLWDYLPELLLIIYGIGVLIFSFRFLKNLYRIFDRIKHNPKLKNENTTSVLLKQDLAPHTFFSYVFFNKEQFEHGKIPPQVFLHEEAHAKQKHSLDILFIELLQIIFWFNPLIYLYNKSIKLNHEFLADQSVIATGTDFKTYQKTLLAFSSNVYKHQLANAINYSSIKKRFIIMKTQTPRKAIWLKSLIMLPLLGILLISFSSKEIIYVSPQLEQVEDLQEKVTPKMIAEYNTLAKKYRKNPNGQIKLKELQRMEYIYKLMSPQQRKAAEPFPKLPEPPKPPKAPKVVKGEKAPKAPKTPKVVKGEKAPKPPKAPKVVKGEKTPKDAKLPPPPPPPPLPEASAYYINGKKVTRGDVHALNTKNIKTVNVVKNKNGNAIYVVTKK